MASTDTPDVPPMVNEPEPLAVRRLTRVSEWLLLLLVVAAPWPFGAAHDLSRYVLAAGLLLAVALWSAGRALRGEGPPRLLLLAATLPALAVLQAIAGRSAAPGPTLEAALLAFALLGVLVLWSEQSRDRASARRLVVAVVLVCGAQALFAAVQASRSAGYVYGQRTPIVTMPFGSYVNHNHFAGLIAMGVLLAVGTAWGHARRAGTLTPQSLVLFGTGVGLTAIHLASRSRGGMVALLGGLIVLGLLFVRSGRGHGRVRALLAAASLGALLFFGVVAIPATTRHHLASVLRGATDASGDYRLDTAVATLRLSAAHPVFGCGLGAFPDAVAAFKTAHGEVRTTHAESDVLELMAESGLIGVGLSLVLAAGILGGFLDRMRFGRDPYRSGIAAGAAAAVAAIGLHSFLDFNLRIPANALVFCSIAGLAAAPHSEPRRFGGRRTWWAWATFALILSGAAAWRASGAWAIDRAMTKRGPQLRAARLDHVLAHHPYLADGYRERARAVWQTAGETPAVRQTRLVQAEADLRRALRLRPAWGEVWADLGWIHFVQGDLGRAKSDLERADRLDPTNPHVSLIQADFLGRTGRTDEAVAVLSRLTLPSVERRLALAAAWTRNRTLLLTLTSGGPEGQAMVERALGGR